MKKFVNVLLVGVIIFTTMTTFFASAHAQEKYVWDLPTVWASTNYQSECLKIFADEIYKRTEGKVKINIHYGGALGYAGPEMLSVVREGLVPIGDLLKNSQTGEEKFFGTTSLPFLATDVTELRMLHLYVRPIEDRLLEKHNQKMLYQVPWPSRNVYTKKKINSLDDLKGLKIRVVNKEEAELFKLLGAVPLQMPWGEVATSLATGIIDAVATSSSSGVDGRFWEFTKFASRWDWQCSCDMVNVNMDEWNKLSPALQKIIETTARELEPKFWKIALEDKESAEKVLIENGMDVHDPTPEFLNAVRKISSKVWEKHMNEVPESKEVIEDYIYIMNSTTWKKLNLIY